ncbi:hypothetical protein VNO77_33910 [Canavalia gladiata]|uniref:Uncharacterized protein n=1 Tax=Canavalia gladiata TaxID=3824 RepID=A0AAN9PY45_CANGL
MEVWVCTILQCIRCEAFRSKLGYDLDWIISNLDLRVPLLRWKKSPVLAATCNLVLWIVSLQLGFYLHMQNVQTHVFKRPAIFSRSLIFATVITSFFSIAMALLKDIPDIEGDKIFGIQSLAFLLGKKRVFWICIVLLKIGYGVGILMGVTSPYLWSKIITGSSSMVHGTWRWWCTTDTCTILVKNENKFSISVMEEPFLGMDFWGNHKPKSRCESVLEGSSDASLSRFSITRMDKILGDGINMYDWVDIDDKENETNYDS